MQKNCIFLCKELCMCKKQDVKKSKLQSISK